MIELLGWIWAAAAPLLLLLPMAAVERTLARRRWPDPDRFPRAPGLRFAIAAIAVTAAVLVLWLPGRQRMAELCRELGPPRILRTAQADGLLVESRIAHSFGMRYLQEEGFTWMEAPSLYRRDGITRYRRQGGRIEPEEVDQPAALHALASEHEPRDGGLSVRREVLRERATGDVLASAATVTYDGGPARWVLGAWGTAQCPNPASAEGSRAFQAAYHLARDTLRPGAR